MRLAALVLIGLCQVAYCDSIDFTYSFPLNGGPAQVTGAGTFTTTPFDPIAGDWTITGITGTRTVDGVTDQILGLLPPGYFGFNDNLLYPNTPYLDMFGFSYGVPAGGDDGKGNVNVFYSIPPDAYTEASTQVGYGTFTIQLVPEPAPPMAIVLAFGGLTYWFQRRRLSVRRR